MTESVAAVLILNALVTVSPILDSHLLGDLKVTFSWKRFLLLHVTYVAFFVIKSLLMVSFAIQVSQQHHFVINSGANCN